MKRTHSIFTPSNPGIWFSGLLCVFTLANISPVLAQPSAVPQERAFISQRKLNTAYGKPYERLLGLTAYGTAVITSTADITSNEGEIQLWNARNQKISGRRNLDIWVSGYDLAISSNGKTLVTSNELSITEFPHAKAYRITSLNAVDLKVSGAFNLKDDDDSVGQLFLPSDNTRVVLKMDSIIGEGKEAYYAKQRFTWLNLKTGKYDKTLSYLPGRGADKILYSLDQKYLLCLYTDMKFDLIDDDRDRFAIVDVLDAKNGKIFWHIQGTKKLPAGEPFFFISPTQFISSDTLFDIPSKSSRPWSAITPTRKCLAAVPGHASYAMFVTPQGLELRDWRHNRTLRRWPTLTKPGRILWSPDLKMFSFKRDSLVQFWKFDPKWLR